MRAEWVRRFIGIKGSRSHFNIQRIAIIMRLLKTLALITTAIVTLATSVFANVYEGQLSSYSDQQVLNYLVREHARDPSTFADAHAYILVNRPAIMEEYLSQTSGWASDTRRFSFAAPGTGETSGAGSMIVLGVVGMATALSLAVDGGGESSGPEPGPILGPSPLPGPGPDPDSGLNDPADYQTREFYRNYGLSLIGADERYAKGGQGQGIKIAILDTGIDTNHPDFAGKIDTEYSYSFPRNSKDISDSGNHGTHVAGIAAGRKDGRGTHGVAFEAELLILQGIGHLSASINRSIEAQAHVINHSWVYTRHDVTIPITDYSSASHLERELGPATIKALKAAKGADLMSIFAAGNDGAPEVSYLAGIPHLLSDYDGYVIAAVAVDEAKNIWDSSNRCGVAKDFCLAAPGVSIPSARNGDRRGHSPLWSSGTSMAAPHIAGAYAVLKSQWPDLTAPIIAEIMFEAAEDLGEPGVDPIYGQGLLNLERAMRPMGELVVYQGNTTEGDAMPLAKTGIVASEALAPALNQALAGQVLMVADKFTRGFDLAASALVSELKAPIPRLTIVREVKASDTVTVMRSDHGTNIRVDGDVSSYEINLGETDPGADPFGQLLTEDYAFGHDVQLTDALALTTDHAIGSSTDTFSRTRIGLEAKDKDGSGFSARVGRIEENGTVLGSRFMGAAGQDGNSNTSFLEISGSVAFGRGTLLTASGTQSRTDFRQEGLVTGGANLMGRAGEVSISQAHFLGSPGTMRLSVSSPLQISSGQIAIDLPQDRVAAVAGRESTGVTRTSETVDITPSERPIDIGLTYQIASDTPGPDILLSAGYRAQGGDADPYIGFALSHSF
ncbi:S8 family peptidase [Cognatiyoonia sp. IB215182]|uniref:S8 family peptidase n=1 Tax=Cognatiyoonia sp. IB215182 TaxID=3097353 RepID=UPI002A17A662|nr:S8 family peptidase [Cognatiyoonia sp. IB215182]MDX8355416.1 S8 family peptidase [Cognatiyoonia sp. IB215182]